MQLKFGLKNLIALCVGLLGSILLLGALELFFQLNENHHWLKERNVNFPPPKSKYSFDSSKLDYLHNLIPYPNPEDRNDPDDYSSMYRYTDCTGPRLDLEPYWAAATSCHARITLHKSRSHRVVYDTYYTFDRHALRIVPSAKEKSDKYLLFLGCSFTWGEGVPDQATFANRITKGFADYNGFNLGMGGYGPNSTLAILQTGRKDIRLSGIHGNTGIAVYTFIDDQMRRLVGTASWFSNPTLENGPYYQLTHGSLERRGSFKTGRPIRTILYKLLSHSAFLRYLKVDIPWIGEADLNLLVAVIKEMKLRLEKDYGVKQFIFAAYPLPSIYMDRLQPKLEIEGITVFNFSTVPAYELMKGRNQIFGNGHPSELGHQFYSDLFLYESRRRGILPKVGNP